MAALFICVHLCLHRLRPKRVNRVWERGTTTAVPNPSKQAQKNQTIPPSLFISLPPLPTVSPNYPWKPLLQLFLPTAEREKMNDSLASISISTSPLPPPSLFWSSCTLWPLRLWNVWVSVCGPAMVKGRRGGRGSWRIWEMEGNKEEEGEVTFSPHYKSCQGEQ